MLVSIIIPVYNTEQYLEKCLDSVINQTFTNIEIICVDDGSTDGSPLILDGYASRDSRIKLIHKENGGLVSARKAGVAVAHGEYVGYVDSDDWIEPDMYEKLLSKAQQYDVDLVTCGYFLDGNYTTIHIDTVSEGLYDANTIQQLRENTIYCMEKRETGLRGSLCCKLFKTEIMKSAQTQIPNEITIAEDKMCLLQYILECKSVYVLKQPFYHWVIRDNSMSHSHHNEYLVKVNHVYNFLRTRYNHPNFSDIMRTEAEIYITELIFLGINKRMGFKNKNMIWIDPYWMDKLPSGSRILLYGAGELGEKYKKQMCCRPDLELVGCVDPKYEALSNEYLIVKSPDNIKDFNYDYIVITIKNKGKAISVRNELVLKGITDEKIIWCEQPEAYWKYAIAEGLA